MTKLTIPIAAKDFQQASQQIKTAIASGAELLELRTDYLEALSTDLVDHLIAETKNASRQPLPIIVTCRDPKEGAANSYPAQLRVDILVSALKAGAEYIDFEYNNYLKTELREKIDVALSDHQGRLILSAHNFDGKFENIENLYRHITTRAPAAIPKLVYKANHINDCFAAFDLLHHTSGERIIFCMGQAGLISRIIAKKLGSFVTFASIDDKKATAPGQLTVEQFKNLYRYDDINSETELFGIIAAPVAHSLSPAVHNSSFADAKANKLYLPLLVEGGKQQFDEFMHNIIVRAWLDFKGFSVTLPHKQNALDYVKENDGFVEPLAEKIGAANTLTIKDFRTSAYNTDYAGAMDAITSALGIDKSALDGLAVAVIGAGGVARAIVAGLSDAGAKIRIYNRTVKKGKKLAAEFSCDFAPLSELATVTAKLLVNCTSIGMHPDVDASPIKQRYLKSEMVVFDTIYNPAETLLLKQAKLTGAKTIDGMQMFVNQAALQFKLFTSRTPNIDLMRRIIAEKLNA